MLIKDKRLQVRFHNETFPINNKLCSILNNLWFLQEFCVQSTREQRAVELKAVVIRKRKRSAAKAINLITKRFVAILEI